MLKWVSPTIALDRYVTSKTGQRMPVYRDLTEHAKIVAEKKRKELKKQLKKNLEEFEEKQKENETSEEINLEVEHERI